MLINAVDCSPKLGSLTPLCDSVYNDQTLRGLFAEMIKFSIRCTLRRYDTGNWEAALKDLAHKAQYLLDIHGGYWKTTENER